MFTRGGREKGGSGGWILGRDARAGACAFVAFLHLEYKFMDCIFISRIVCKDDPLQYTSSTGNLRNVMGDKPTPGKRAFRLRPAGIETKFLSAMV